MEHLENSSRKLPPSFPTCARLDATKETFPESLMKDNGLRSPYSIRLIRFGVLQDPRRPLRKFGPMLLSCSTRSIDLMTPFTSFVQSIFDLRLHLQA